jgi:high-affinity Fe2+/Pb2+ permease
VLVLLSIVVVASLVNVLLHKPNMLVGIVLLFVALGVLWWVWTQIPLWFRKAIYKMLKRKRDDHEGRGRR